MKHFFQTIVLSCLVAGAVAQSPPAAVIEKTSCHQLGDKQICIKTSTYGSVRANVLINLHHNETTSLQAAHSFLAENGGSLINIENQNERFITFRLNGRSFRFDPNRIFTEAGIRLTLNRLNKNVPPAAFRSVKRFAAFLKTKIPGYSRTIVAVHNNDEEGDLSVRSYVSGVDLQKEARQVHQSHTHDADNFFLTTSQTFFNKLKKEGYNVVLQHNKKVTDDGSLSVYFARKRKAYVNVEAELGRLADQQEMLNALLRLSRK